MRTRLTIALLTLFISQVSLWAQPQTNTESLHAAALQGNLATVEEYIQKGVDLNQKDPFGSTPLIIATTFGKSNVAIALIRAGADLSIANRQGSTPLHIAAFFCHEDIVNALLDQGADRHLRNSDGATPYDIVAAPASMDSNIYAQLQAGLGSLGLKIDFQFIEKTRPKIAELLRPKPLDLEELSFTPIERNDWAISNPEVQGLPTARLSELYQDASYLKTLYSVLVIKNGYLIGESYFNKGSIDQLSKRASVTKSYVSALMGIAIDKGYISGEDEKMLSYFPEIKDEITDPRKLSITLQQMLQMRAGYPWEESKPQYWDTLWTGRYLHAIEGIPLTHDPGTEFQYSNLTSNWLATIISRAAKTDLKSFAQEHLFSPLKVSVGEWNRDLDGNYIGSGDMEVTARDMAKFGWLYLNGGQIEGQQLVPSDWVEASTQKYSTTINSVGLKSGRLGRYFNEVGYGYQWWSGQVGNHAFHFAWGHGGQLIVLLEDLDMVIVTTADPFYGKEAHFDAWKNEQAIINLVGKFIQSLP